MRVGKQVAKVGIGMALVLLGGVTSPSASNVINACNQTCETDCSSKPSNCRQASGSPPKCVLGGDLSCTAAQGAIELASGHDLDLQGYDITCTETAPALCNYSAIYMSATSSRVVNSSSNQSVISGRFGIGVDCGSRASSLVEDITVNDGFIGIYSCQTVRNTVVGPSSDFNQWAFNMGIYTAGISNSDSVTDNYVAGRMWPIYSESPYRLDVERNVTKGAGYAAITVGAGQSTSTGNVRFNIMFGASGGSIDGAATTDNSTYDGNFCDPDLADCASCITAGRCMPYTSPFVGN